MPSPDITAYDEKIMENLLIKAKGHNPKSRFHMVAMYANRKSRNLGYNELKTSPLVVDADYGSWAGIHAELDLLRRLDAINNPENLIGGTIYINGVNHLKTPMTTTKPCPPCCRLLYKAGVDFVVFKYESDITKATPRNLIL